MAVPSDEIAFVYPLRPLPPPQKGGSLSIYAGQRYYPYHVYQTGNGFLDVLKGIGRFLFPIITSSAGSFISNATRRYNEEGKSIKDAAKESLRDAGAAGVEALGRQIQKGKGHRRRSKRIFFKSEQHKKKKSGSKRGRRVYKKRANAAKKLRITDFSNF